MTDSKTISSGRPDHLGARREIVINVLAHHGLAKAIDNEMVTGTWAILHCPAGTRGFKPAVYEEGHGWIDGRLGLWADAEVIDENGDSIALPDENLFIPNISRDQACDLAQRFEHQFVIFGAAGRYTSINTVVRHSGRDNGWHDVPATFPLLAGSASRSVNVAGNETAWRCAEPKRRVGRNYEYLFSRGRGATYSLAPTHFYYQFATDRKYRETQGLVPWAAGTPQQVGDLAIWLPLIATAGSSPDVGTSVPGTT